VLLSWDDEDCLGPYQSSSRSTFYVHATAWSRGLEVTGGGTGVVSHAGLVLLRQLSDRTGLTAGLSAALPSPEGGLDRGRVFADLACAIADGARVISDFRVMGDQDEVFGQVASVPTAWRMLKETASGGDRTRRKITAAVNRARRYAWSQVVARHGQLPPVQVADRQLTGITCIRLDATVVPAHSSALDTRSRRRFLSFPKVRAVFPCVVDVKEQSLIVRWHLDHLGGSNAGEARRAASRRGRGGRAGG
jgi:hypothetical protein